MKKQIIKSFIIGLTFFIGLSSGYVMIFAALDWTNLKTDVVDGSTLTAELWNNSMLNIKNNIDGIQTIESDMGKFGSVVTVWGRKSAPTGSTLLYSGIGFGAHYTHTGGSRTCMKGGDAGSSTSGNGDLLYPLTTGSQTYMPPGATGDKQIFCSEVFVPSTIFKTFGTHSCPTNWSLLYKGYSMNSYYNHANGNTGEGMCVDTFNFDTSKTQTSTSGSYIVGTKVTSTSDSGSVPAGKFVKCAVCTKQ